MGRPNPDGSNRAPKATTVPKLGRFKAQKVRESRAAQGFPAMVDSVRVREHLMFLHDEAGFSDNAIAAAAGVSQGTVSRIRLGKHSTTSFEHACRILAVGHVPVPAQARLLVPAIGTRRRLETLQAAGYSTIHIGAELGVSAVSVRWYRGNPRVLFETWQAVTDLYERWSGVPGPSTAAARDAARKEIWLPMEWHGLDMDDPRVRPRRCRYVPMTQQERIDERRTQVRALRDEGLTLPEIAERLGTYERQVQRDLASPASGGDSGEWVAS